MAKKVRMAGMAKKNQKLLTGQSGQKGQIGQMTRMARRWNWPERRKRPEWPKSQRILNGHYSQKQMKG